MRAEKLARLAEQLFSSVESYVARSVDEVERRTGEDIIALTKRIAELERKLAEAESKRLRSVA